jgi:hypothetical protein
VNATATVPLFDTGELIVRPRREATRVKVAVADEDVTGVAGAALWGPLLDRLNVVDAADARDLRPIGPGGYSGGECYRTLVEVLLAGGEFLSDRSLLEGATEALRGEHAFPSHTTLFRFLAGADLGRAQKAAAVDRTVLARAWAMGAAPPGERVTIDADATLVATYGPAKQGSTFTYRGETGMSPLLGICSETGDVLAVRARAGNAHPGRRWRGSSGSAPPPSPCPCEPRRACGCGSIPLATSTRCSPPARRWGRPSRSLRRNARTSVPR